MKGKKKYIVPLLLAGMTASAGIVTNVQQATTVTANSTQTEISNVVGKNVKVGGFKDNYTIGDFVEMPEVKIDGVVYAEDVFTVTKGKRNIPVVKENGKWGFYANLEGLYNVAVSAPNPDNDQVVSEITNLSVWVEKEDATINLPINSSRVIPAKMPKGQTGFEIPAPTVTVTNDEGKEVTKTASEILADDATNDDKLVVRLVTPVGIQTLALPTEGEDRDYYAVKPEYLNTIGTYQILYEYYKGDTIITRLDSNFQVVKDGAFLDKIDLTMSILDSIPATGTVNTDIKIPKIKVVESVGAVDAVNTYVEVTITNLNTGKTIAQKDINYKDYTFCPKEQGSYLVSYKASIPLFGKTTAPVSPDQVIEVTDNKAPTLRATYNYTVENGSITSVNGKNVSAVDGKTNNEVAAEMLVNRKCDIPSVAQLKKVGDNKSVQVTIPAVFAEDNLSEYKDIVFEREYRKPNGEVIKLDNTQYPVNQSATITLDTKGPYLIRYRAYDAENNRSGEIEQSLYVYDVDGVTEEDFTKGKTDINFYVGSTSITSKEGTLNITKPTVKDTYDSDVDIKTFYDVYKDATKTSEANELIETNGNGEYEIDVKKLISDNPGITEIKLYSVAYLDATRPGVVSNEVKSEVYSVKIVNSDIDVKAADISIDTYASWNEALFAFNSQEDADKGITTNILSKDVAGATGVNAGGYATNGSGVMTKEINGVDVDLALFDQGSDILHLPTIKFTDDLDTNLRIKVAVKDTFGNTVPFTTEPTVRKDKNSNVYTVSGAKFKLSSYDVYTVTYTAIDMNGNVTVQSYGIRVNDKTTPTIVVDDQGAFGKDIEVGEFFSFPNARLVKDGRTEQGTITWDVYKKSDNAECYVTNNGFVPETEGTYFISCTAIDKDGNIVTLKDETFKVNAVKSSTPEIRLDLNYYMPEFVEWQVISEKDDYMLIDIARAYPVDSDEEVVYTVTGPNSNTIKVQDYEESDAKYEHRRFFKAEKEGIYKIKYQITVDGKTSTIDKSVSIGDCVKPTVENINIQKTFNLNDTFKFNLVDAGATLWDDKTDPSEIEVDAKLYYQDTTEVKTTGIDGEWKFDKTGTYTLKISLKDKAGNTNTESISIEVKSEEADTKEISPVLGTVLIVLSVVVLAGVVVYFVVSSKKKTAKSTSKKK